MTINIIWQTKKFTELSLNQLYDLLKLRVDVFVVEQTCFYPDLDSEMNQMDRHPETRHLMGYQEGELVAYLRILPKGQSYPEHVGIGRVVISPKARGRGFGHQLIKTGIAQSKKIFPKESIKISAQEHLKAYYQQHKFMQVSEMYLEDDIPHIAMIQQA